MASLMKGNTWHKRKDAVDRKGNHIVTYPVYVEDKHDEIRCHVTITLPPTTQVPSVVFTAYSGKPLANMQRFASMFLELHRGTGHREFDMGFECNGNFNDSYRWVRSTSGIPHDLFYAKFKFLLFGLPALGGSLSQQLTERYAVASYAADWVSHPVIVPEVVVCDNQHDVENAYLNARARGLEGVMVKQVKALYERKRTDGWLKMKPEEEADGIITELHEAICGVDQPELGLSIGDHLGRIGSITLRMEDGSEATPHGIPHDLGREMFLNPQAYIGEWAEMHFMERDRCGGYRHPVFWRLREPK